MSPGDYVLAMMAIISGLAITHLIGATSALVEHRARVQWDWLAVTAGFYVAYIVIYGWWFSWAAFHAQTAVLPFYRFLLPTANVIFLALAARAVLPERVPDEGLNLAEHYARRCRFIFVCLLVCDLVSMWGTLIRLWAGVDVAALLPGGYLPNFIGMAGVATLAVVRRRAVHAVIMPALFAMLVAATIVKVV